MNRRILVTGLGLIVALALGAGGGYWWAKQSMSTHAEGGSAQATPERKPLFYRNPMNPSITSPVPAKDEMGMDYIPVYADEDTGSSEPAGTVKIDPTIAQNIGVRTAKAERQTLSRSVRAVGRVAYDEQRLARLHPKIEGWVEELFVDKTGESVEKDTILLALYSPQLVTSQQEYLLALRNLKILKDSPYPDVSRGASELVKSARERLALLDVPAHQIRELERTGRIQKALHIHSPFAGIVMNVGAREGQYVTPQTELYMIVDLSKVWVYVDIYEYELPWVSVGDEAELRLAAFPGRRFTGRIAYIYPYMESKTRTIRVRLEFDNPDRSLKPDMYADVTLHAGRQVDAVTVPSEAIVRSGDREQVFVQKAPGKFEPREVRLGVSAAGRVQILEGVEAGEMVVTSSQFLIDSESKLREATAKMLEATATEPTASDMSMDDLSMDDLQMDDMDMSDMTLDSPPAEPSAPERPHHD